MTPLSYSAMPAIMVLVDRLTLLLGWRPLYNGLSLDLAAWGKSPMVPVFHCVNNVVLISGYLADLNAAAISLWQTLDLWDIGEYPSPIVVTDPYWSIDLCWFFRVLTSTQSPLGTIVTAIVSSCPGRGQWRVELQK